MRARARENKMGKMGVFSRLDTQIRTFFGCPEAGYRIRTHVYEVVEARYYPDIFGRNLDS